MIREHKINYIICLHSRYNGCFMQVNLFGTNFQSQLISNPGTGIFWQSFNGNYSSLQQIILAIIPYDFDTTSNYFFQYTYIFCQQKY